MHAKKYTRQCKHGKFRQLLFKSINNYFITNYASVWLQDSDIENKFLISLRLLQWTRKGLWSSHLLTQTLAKDFLQICEFGSIFRFAFVKVKWVDLITIGLQRLDADLLGGASLFTKMYEKGSMTGCSAGVDPTNSQSDGKNVQLAMGNTSNKLFFF